MCVKNSARVSGHEDHCISHYGFNVVVGAVCFCLNVVWIQDHLRGTTFGFASCISVGEAQEKDKEIKPTPTRQTKPTVRPPLPGLFTH